MNLRLNITTETEEFKNVTLSLSNGVPLVYMPATFGAKKTGSLLTRDYAISEDSYDVVKLNTIATNPPALVDVEDNNVDRFVFITVVASYMQKIETYLYHDTKNNMVFMMPDPNMLESGHFVEGTIIGVRSSGSLNYNPDNTRHDLTDMTFTGNPVTTVTVLSRGLEKGGADNYRIKLSEEVTSASSRAGVIEYAVITDAITFNSDVNYVPIIMSNIGVRKVGKLISGSPSELLIPIIF